MLLEDREQKLKMRLPYDVDEADPTMHLTASWVFSGPTMTDLKADIEEAIEREAGEIREAIADGTETAPVMEIPVQISNTYTATRELIEEFATSKGYEVSYRGDIHERDDDLERLTRLFLRVLGTADRPHRACPSDVAEAMLHIARSTRCFDFISIKDISTGCHSSQQIGCFPNSTDSDETAENTAQFSGSTGPISNHREGWNLWE